jgi:hypothetical protein
MFDTNKKLSHKSWTVGGTHITNFSSNELGRYAKTFELYEKENPKHSLVISAFAYTNDDKTLIKDYCSLHITKSNKGFELDGFWKVYDSLYEYFL